MGKEMDPLIIRASRWRYITPLVGCVVIVAGSIVVSLERGTSWFAWVLIAVFGAGAIGSLTMLFESRTRLMIDRAGVWDFTWGIGTVRWSEIREVFVRRIGDEEFICFTVFDREDLQARRDVVKRKLNDATRSLGYGDPVVDAKKLGLDTREVVEFATKMIAESR